MRKGSILEVGEKGGAKKSRIGYEEKKRRRQTYRRRRSSKDQRLCLKE